MARLKLDPEALRVTTFAATPPAAAADSEPETFGSYCLLSCGGPCHTWERPDCGASYDFC